MKIKKNFILREVAGTYLVVAVGDAVKDFNKAINLNSTGAFLWKQLQVDLTEEELIGKLLEEYEIDRETAKKDILGFIQRLREANLLE
ncbi:MAG: PqqD family protein [Clostridia bacterium]|nr:PqqD family protein [Clostridia bacterium]